MDVHRVSSPERRVAIIRVGRRRDIAPSDPSKWIATVRDGRSVKGRPVWEGDALKYFFADTCIHSGDAPEKPEYFDARDVRILWPQGGA